MQIHYLSRNGYNRLQQKKQELLDSIKAKKKQMGISVSIDNDLRENSEFMQLRTEVTYVLPKKLDEVNFILSSCQIIEDMTSFIYSQFNKVQLGARVTVQYQDGKIVSFTILGYDEADFDRNIISYLSPLAQSLMGRVVGDEVEVDVPGKPISVKILNIEKGI